MKKLNIIKVNLSISSIEVATILATYSQSDVTPEVSICLFFLFKIIKR